MATIPVLTPHPASGGGLLRAPSVFEEISHTDAFDPSIRVMELGQVDRVMWEANILYAMGRIEEIRTTAKMLQEKGLDVGYELSIALLRLDGNKAAFEDMAVDYAVQTGSSPPVWLDAHDKLGKAAATPKRVLLSIQSLMAESITETTIKMESPWPLTLDFAEVTKLDSVGLDIFQESLAGRIARSESTLLLNSEKMLASISRKIINADYQGNAGLWTFCFNAHRITGNRSAFDDLIGDFVEKTGEDMPVWKDLRDPEEVMKSKENAQKPVIMGFNLGDSLSKVNKNLLKTVYDSKQFKDAMKMGKNLCLDFSEVNQWTITDMGGVLGLIEQAKKDNVKLDLINLNEMLFCLFKGFGLDKKAKLVVAGATT